MNLNNLEQIKIEIEKFFDKTTFRLDVDISYKEDSTVYINVNSDEPQILIGE
jgi:predicted RNA-binding protein Jag